MTATCSFTPKTKTLCFHVNSFLVSVTVAAMKHQDQEQLWEKRVYFIHSSKTVIIKNSEGRNSSTTGSWGRSCRGHEGVLHTGLLLVACSACFLFFSFFKKYLIIYSLYNIISDLPLLPVPPHTSPPLTPPSLLSINFPSLLGCCHACFLLWWYWAESQNL